MGFSQYFHYQHLMVRYIVVSIKKKKKILLPPLCQDCLFGVGLEGGQRPPDIFTFVDCLAL